MDSWHVLTQVICAMVDLKHDILKRLTFRVIFSLNVSNDVNKEAYFLSNEHFVHAADSDHSDALFFT